MFLEQVFQAKRESVLLCDLNVKFYIIIIASLEAEGKIRDRIRVKPKTKKMELTTSCLGQKQT